ncbi:MAG: septum formation protein Maf [Bacteroidaceae bacterium]|nr:septum formation protein Maf [Bacteroidaceae bacterium]
MKIILASNSPRRKELLAGLGYAYEVRVLSDIDESYPDTLKGSEVAAYISCAKAAAYAQNMAADELIITADTIVCLDEQVLGKPADEAEAIAMLRSLSGRTHQVYTGVALTTKAKQTSFVSCSHVTFASLTDEEIQHYVTHYRPMDKAGAYGIQEWIGYIGVERIEGSYFNVMGLPVQRLYTELKALL